MKLNFSQTRIAVFGDLILDTYYIGKVNRISPEAPVPVVNVKTTKHVLGGASNVANNIRHLKGNPLLIGAIGKDHNGKIITRLLKEEGIETLLLESELPTINKIRIIGEHQQIVRMDFEENTQEAAARMLELLKKQLPPLFETIQGIIISDYGKGLCSPELCNYLIQIARKSDKFVIVDPKGKDWNKYKGSTIITPNFKEFDDVVRRELLNNNEEIGKIGKEVRQKYELDYLLITRSEAGMTLIEKEKSRYIPAKAREVYDVSGAGDTVVATLGVSVASGFKMYEAAKLANFAAGIVVSKFGTIPIEFDELADFYHSKKSKKIVSKETLVKYVKNFKEAGQKIVFTNGCFDILHRGHLTYLKQAKELGDILIVGVNSDTSVKILKGDTRPINNEEDRLTLLSGFEFIDYLCLFTEETPISLIKSLSPDILVKGGDYTVENVVGREFAGETKIIPFVEGYSTSKIVSLINSTREKN